MYMLCDRGKILCFNIHILCGIVACVAGEKYCDWHCVETSHVCNYHLQCISSDDEKSCTSQGKYQYNMIA